MHLHDFKLSFKCDVKKTFVDEISKTLMILQKEQFCDVHMS